MTNNTLPTANNQMKRDIIKKAYEPPQLKLLSLSNTLIQVQHSLWLKTVLAT